MSTLYYICLVLLVVGVLLLLAAAVQEFGGIAIFSDAPWLTGVALSAIGGVMVRELRKKRREDEA